MKPGIVTNLELCSGCWTCAAACSVAYKLPDDTKQWWLTVKSVGDSSGAIDEPAGAYPNFKLSWEPIMWPSCTLCPARTARNLEPYCVWNCPNHARAYGDLDDPMSKISVAMKGYRDRGYKIYQLPDAGTTTHVAAYYVEKPK